ncbi:MAG: flavin reductase family protein [Desulfobacterales bacterium]|nr:flavin reductase family protein [Desulfobacterales bacterium]
MPIVLVTAQFEGIRNIMTAAWSTPASFEPPLIILCIGHSRTTHDLVLKSGEFGLNILSDEQMALANYCGNTSGQEVDKFREMKIPLCPSRIIGAPLVAGCASTMEIKVRSHFPAGDHTAFVGETVDYREDPTKLPLIR